MSDSLNISVVEWLASESGDPVEKYTSADLSIVVGTHRVTEVEDYESKTVRKAIRVSAGLAAMWFASNWWRLRWEAEPTRTIREDLNWAMSHQIAAIGGGYTWPDLVFKGSDGELVSVICKGQSTADAEVMSSIRYLNSFSTQVDASSLESSIGAFVEKVIARLDSCGVRKSELHELWDDVLYEKRNSQAFAHRKLEALLGLDPDEDDALIGSLSKWSRKFGQHALEEISAAVDISHISKTLETTKQVAQGVKTFASVPSLIALDVDGPPWQRGKTAAYALRRKWGLETGPITDETFANCLDISLPKLCEVKENAPFSFGLRGVAENKLGFILNRPHDHSRRFDTARLIGDQVCFELTDLLRPTTPAETVRQKVQRAFAAEFLCPSETIKDRFPDGLERGRIGEVVADLSKEYNVSGQVIFHHMQNRKILPDDIGQGSLLVA
jgi:hypothetical protein